MPINIVLVEPQIPQNTGNIARTCSVTGAKLHLVGPLGFSVDDKKLKRAGLDYWHLLDISEYNGVEDFFASTSGAKSDYYFFTTKGKKSHTEINYNSEREIFLVFGREDAGLPPSILSLDFAQKCRIPMKSETRSLNLSNAVAVGVYEVLRQWDYQGLE